ncbi:hypothetical protein Cni_G04214 [Canna indica]|uniref:tRNA (guanine(46)-N(7))-methyltransferase n=1 Tax=Canna indica TaxID=4628 RepID=A0AAQ3JV17_9LILI|nr:hypothetical protein Cni_G04214 [Canna indica]
MLGFRSSGWRWHAALVLGSPASTSPSPIHPRVGPIVYLRRRSLNLTGDTGGGKRWCCKEPRETGVHGGEGRRLKSAAVRSPDAIEVEYADLNLKDFYGAAPHLGHVRIRQHVNPLSSSFSTPAEVPEWKSVFRDPTQPLMVDIGSGSGRFLIWLAKNCRERGNYLGLEIRQKLVERSQFWVKELQLENIHFMFANAMVSFETLVSAYPGPLILVSILCPDPYFKKRHHKRRVVQTSLVNSIAKNLSVGGQVFMQSDVFDVALDMRDQFDARSDVFEHVGAIDHSFLCDDQGWVLHNPMGIRTEREIHAELEGARIYRRIYQKHTQYLPCTNHI